MNCCKGIINNENSIITHHQYVIYYSLYPNPTDTCTLIPKLEEFKKQYGFYPNELTAGKWLWKLRKYNYYDK